MNIESLFPENIEGFRNRITNNSDYTIEELLLANKIINNPDDVLICKLVCAQVDLLDSLDKYGSLNFKPDCSRCCTFLELEKENSYRNIANDYDYICKDCYDNLSFEEQEKYKESDEFLEC